MSGQPESVSFRTRARTIDHLGREQIADVPTAVSELWNNAYDAYARSVSLHLYAGERPSAAIFDDGFGMSREDFLGRWLVVGTESKAADEAVPAELRDGLRERPKQGQKGIGRLSVAAIGAAVLVVSKGKASRFVAGLLDWRLFENPFLLLEDVTVPVVEFDSTAELARLAPLLRESLLANVDGRTDDEPKRVRLREAWKAFDRLERSRDGVAETTSARIRALAKAQLPSLKPLDNWGVWTGERATGTALVLADVNPFLTAWVSGPQGQRKDDVEVVLRSLQRTLTGFSDPYSADDLSLDYRACYRSRSGARPRVPAKPGSLRRRRLRRAGRLHRDSQGLRPRAGSGRIHTFATASNGAEGPARSVQGNDRCLRTRAQELYSFRGCARSRRDLCGVALGA